MKFSSLYSEDVPFHWKKLLQLFLMFYNYCFFSPKAAKILELAFHYKIKIKISRWHSNL